MSGDVGLHGPAKWQSTNDDNDVPNVMKRKELNYINHCMQ